MTDKRLKSFLSKVLGNIKKFTSNKTDERI